MEVGKTDAPVHPDGHSFFWEDPSQVSLFEDFAGRSKFRAFVFNTCKIPHVEDPD